MADEKVVKVGGDMVLETEVAKLNALLQAAVADGHIVAVIDEVTVSDKASPTGKGARRDYLKLLTQDAEGMAATCNGKIEPATRKPAEGKDERTEDQKAAGACDYFNYGHDLEVKAEVRQLIMNGLEGPEKQIKKAFDGMVLAGYSKSEASDLVRNSPKFKGVDGLENLLIRAAA